MAEANNILDCSTRNHHISLEVICHMDYIYDSFILFWILAVPAHWKYCCKERECEYSSVFLFVFPSTGRVWFDNQSYGRISAEVLLNEDHVILAIWGCSV